MLMILYSVRMSYVRQDIFLSLQGLKARFAPLFSRPTTRHINHWIFVALPIVRLYLMDVRCFPVKRLSHWEYTTLPLVMAVSEYTKATGVNAPPSLRHLAGKEAGSANRIYCRGTSSVH